MTNYYYLIQCEDREPRTVLGDIKYIHIKGHTSGKQVAIITEKQIKGKNIVEKTEKEIQVILDSWISEENKNPSKFTDLDRKEVDILQSNISVKSITKVVTDIKQRVR